MPTLETDHTSPPVPWVVAIGAVALLPAFYVPVPAVRDFFYLPKAVLLLALELSLVALLCLRRLVQGRSALPVRNPLAAPLLVYWAALAASTGLSIDPWRSLLGAQLRVEGLVTFLLYGGLILLLPLAAQQGPSLRDVAGGHAQDRIDTRVDTLLRWGVAVMMLIVIYGLVQRYGLDPAPRDAIRDGTAVGASWWKTSAFSTLGNSNFFGTFTAAYLLFASVRYLSAPDGDATLFWLAGAGFAYYGVLTSLSRGAWLAAGATGVAALILLAVSGQLPRRPRLLLLVSLLAALTVVWRLADPLSGQRVAALAADAAHQSGTVGQRLWIWRGTWHAIAARPLLGWGLESLAAVFPNYEPPGRAAVGLSGWLIDRAHNDFLQVAVSSGLLGLAAYLWLLWNAAKTGWRILQWPTTTPLARSLVLGLLAGGLAHLFAVGTNISTVSESPTFWGFLGLLATLAMATHSGAAGSAGPAKRVGTGHQGQ